jgi:hypothetical protein
MVLRVCIFFILCLFEVTGFAQSNTDDVIYLKNGGVTRGVILEIIPEKTVKIQTNSGNVFVYNLSEIEKIVKEKAISKTENNDKPEIIYVPYKSDTMPKMEFKKEGYSTIIKLGPGNSGSTINIINGYQFNPYVFLGMGVGLDMYYNMLSNDDLITYNNAPNSRLSDYFLPTYIDVRYYVRGASRTTFYVYLDLGYSTYLGGKANDNPDYTSTNSYTYNSNIYNNGTYNNFKPTSGGTFICPGVGFKVFLTKKFAMVSDLGVKIQNFEALEYSSYSGTNTRTNLMSAAPMINFGIAF